MKTDLVGIARRENNNKRNYLVVNTLQGKHVPADPCKTLELFDQLAAVVMEQYGQEKVLLVGFAETATAIGARVAVKTGSDYIQTTREDIGGVEYLYFTESHSHATEQKLIKTDLDKVIDKINRIIFIEDEVTTGNTILKIINIIKKVYHKKLGFSVASILNGMDEASIRNYKSNDIRIHYLMKTDHAGFSQIARGYAGDGNYYGEFQEDVKIKYAVCEAKGYVDARRLTGADTYQNACDMLWHQIEDREDFCKNESLLVIGTEEFMYPAIYAAYQFSRRGCAVKCHATTRSPIEVSSEEDYPLHNRYQLSSVYDDNRKTFIYDIGKYDKVIIITDSENSSEKGINSLINAVAYCKNTDITLVRWCR